MSVAPYGLTILCDDIREELHGKSSYIGIYGGDIIIAGQVLPVTLPKLCIAFHYREPLDWPPALVKFQAFFPGNDAPLFEAPIDITKEIKDSAEDARSDPGGSIFTELRLHVALAPCVLKEEGRIRTCVSHPTAGLIRLGNFKVRLANPAVQ
ncbi:MAG: hypothetical protein U1E67_10355 [Hyphomicrobiales bacterium]